MWRVTVRNSFQMFSFWGTGPVWSNCLNDACVYVEAVLSDVVFVTRHVKQWKREHRWRRNLRRKRRRNVRRICDSSHKRPARSVPEFDELTVLTYHFRTS